MEAVIAAVVVVTLTVLFGIVAQKDKIFKVRIDLVSEGKKSRLFCCNALLFSAFSILLCWVAFSVREPLCATSCIRFTSR